MHARMLNILDLEQLSPELKSIAQKVKQGDRISSEDCLILFDQAELGYLGALANHIRNKRHGNKTYFNRNFHLEPTNVCLYTCTFCSYSRLIKKREEGWEYSHDEMMDMLASCIFKIKGID